MSDAFAGLTEREEDFAPGADPTESFAGRLSTAPEALSFILSGRATVTFQGRSRFTYKISAPAKEGSTVPDYNSQIRWVQVLTGNDNESSYRYLGYIKRGVYFHGGRKAKIAHDAPSAVAFAWSYGNLARGQIPAGLQVWHEGRCGRCGRKLTVPESIASGYGPECINHVHH